jgi:penicillin-binding protein 1C
VSATALARAARPVLAALAAALLAALALAHLVPLPPRLSRPRSRLVLDAKGEWLRVQVTPDDGGMLRLPVEPGQVPAALERAVLAFEDRRFFLHPGVDPVALARALAQNLAAGRVVSGGSTLTMQVARMLERRPRTLGAKALEALRALQLELRFSKRELLALYFELAPYGGNLEGVASAAWLYYGKPPERLALDELATLAALPNSPTRLDPRRNPEGLRLRRNDVLARLAAEGAIDPEEARAAMALPVHAERRRPPLVAPHLAEHLWQRRPDLARHDTTLDGALQRTVEALVAEHAGRLAPHGIGNAAVVVIENAPRAVRAYVGSRAFFDLASQGQVDGARALRSPGSTLKPFVYLLALERGLVGVNTLLEDVPIAYPGWSPGNFDGRHRGLVSARAALAGSLNVPAVRLAERLEPDGLVALLERAGFGAFNAHPGRYGLATVLGGADVHLLELTNLYATLALGGLHAPWRLLAGDPEPAPRRLFSPAAAYLVTEVLTDLARPELPDTWRQSLSAPRIAWKTGTSYGRRDAWSVGYTPRWSVGVWVGNFDGRGVPELVGVEAAAPLLFALARVLPGMATDPWFEAPPGLERREVCALSGAPPGTSCPHRVGELALADVAPREPCRHHVELEIEDVSGLRVCGRCRQGRATHREVHVVWPPSVAGYLRDAGWPVAPVPVHDPRCTHGLLGAGPVIRSPADGDVFVLRPGVPPALQQLALVASSGSGAGPVYWFVDDALAATVPAGQTAFVDPVPGDHHLVAMDAEGRRSAVRITVRELPPARP